MQYFGFDRPSFGFKTFGFGDNFDPLDLFVGGKQGVWYDPSDKSTLFQDVAGTVPVTKDGDPVALMRDKSGNGNHAKQTVTTSRAVYKTDGILHWLAFDGVDDYLVADYSLKSKTHIISTSVNLINRAGQKGILECFGDDGANPAAAADFKKGSRLFSLHNAFYHQIGDGTNRYTSTIPSVSGLVRLISRVNNTNVDFWVNNTVQSSVHEGTMTASSKTYIGSNSAILYHAQMHFYGAMILERDATSGEFMEIKSYLSSIAGLTSA